MKKVVLDAAIACKAVILAIGFTFTSCLDWNEKEPEITVDYFPPGINIIAESELIEKIAIVKAFSFDNPYLEENENDLIATSHYKSLNFIPEYGKFVLTFPFTVSDEKLRKFSDVSNEGIINNPAAQVACLQYFRAYDKEDKYIGYFECGLYRPDDEIGFYAQIWYANSEVTYTTVNGELIFTLRKEWNWVYERDDRDLYDKGYRFKWRFTEL